MKKLHVLLLVFIVNIATASIVIPTVNLGQYADESDVVGMFTVRAETSEYEDGRTYEFYHLKMVDCWKCDFQVTKIKKMSYRLDNGLNAGFDNELHLEVGKTYLLFLSKTPTRFYPALLNYAIMEEVIENGEKYLVTSQSSKAISLTKRPDGKIIEPLGNYVLGDLKNSILQYLDNKNWESNTIQTNLSIDGIFKAAPAGCLYLGDDGATIIGWRFENSTIDSYTDDDGDDDKADAETCIDNAISAINSSYNVFLNSSGTTDYNPTCSGGSASDGYPDYADANLSGGQSLLHIFNDPCDEIGDLSGCSGTLAIGGAYYYGSVHTFNGSDWHPGAYAYVIYNNGTGACQNCSEYEMMSTHEMDHGLGQDHINAGTYPNNNMNPTCCNPIATKDIECSDHAYLDGALPIVLRYFKAKIVKEGIELSWDVEQEINCMSYVVERSTDAFDWSVIIDEVCENSSKGAKYSAIDDNILASEYYYRLKQTDFDGTATYFDVVHIKTEVENNEWQLSQSQDHVELIGVVSSFNYKVFNTHGQLVDQSFVNLARIDTRNWTYGINYLQIESEGRTKVFTIYK